jgi:hypothetical protein
MPVCPGGEDELELVMAGLYGESLGKISSTDVQVHSLKHPGKLVVSSVNPKIRCVDTVANVRARKGKAVEAILLEG